jgi:hypothetical protein
MNIEDARDIQIAIRKKLSPQELSPELLQKIIDVILEYIFRDV